MDASADFKPSQVYLSSGPPLGATMRKTEREAAAAYLVRVCHDHGDVWQPVTNEMLKKTIEQDAAANRDPVASWIQNPFLKPDMIGLIADGFAECSPNDLTNDSVRDLIEGDVVALPVSFTQAGLDALKPYVRRLAPAPQSA